MSNEIEIESAEISHTNSNLNSNYQEEDKGKNALQMEYESFSHRNRHSNELKRISPLAMQEINNFSIKTNQPLCMKSIDKQEGISQIDYIPSLNEFKRGDMNSEYGTNRIFIFNRDDDKNENNGDDNTNDATNDNCVISSFLKKVNKQQFFAFLLSPIQKKIWLRCKIKKEKINSHVLFYCSLNDYDDLLMLISPINANKYGIYTNLDFKSDNLIPIGKIKKNFLGTSFSLRTTIEEFTSPKIYINYSINVLGMAGPMGLKVNIPLDNNDKEVIQLSNKSPVYSEHYKCYVLDYVNRKDVQCSIKNFQLISSKDNQPNKKPNDELDSEERKKIILQFGVIEDNCYLLDFKYPLSPIQAFSIGISNLHNKILCE